MIDAKFKMLLKLLLRSWFIRKFDFILHIFKYLLILYNKHVYVYS